jgi:hypothetical protein
MKNKINTLILLMACSLTSVAQIGVGTSSPNANAALDVVSTSQGILFPRLTTAQRDAIVGPAKGLTIFNTTLNCIQTNIGTGLAVNWKCLAGISPSSNGTAIVSAYTSSNYTGIMGVGYSVSGVTQTITATVKTAGTYNISSTNNGVTFAASGTFESTGALNIVLTATGTPTAAGSNSFVLNTTPSSSFSRTTSSPIPSKITLSAIGTYYTVSVYDQDYLPYSAPTVAASLATAQAANSINETFTLNIQGGLSTTGVSIRIPYTCTSAATLPAFTQTINVPATYTEDGISRNVIFSYSTASLFSGSGTIIATLKSSVGALNAKKLDLQTGIGNDGLGWLLGQLSYFINSSGGIATFEFRNIAPIPDRNVSDAAHVMFYKPVSGFDDKTWLNNNLGADYANTTIASFNPETQASGLSSDYNAHGSLFQWGRYSDGHELMNWTSNSTVSAIYGTSIILSSTDNPGNSLFIKNSDDWRDTQNINLWQGESGTNNPCPIGYRLPTLTELDNQRLSWSSNTSTGNLATPVTLPLSGYRVIGSQHVSLGTSGRYWSSSVASTYSRFLNVNASSGSTYVSSTGSRVNGLSVRCIKD